MEYTFEDYDFFELLEKSPLKINFTDLNSNTKFSEFLDIKDPAALMPMSGGANNAVQMGMVPWQPFSKSKEFTVPRSWIVTVSEPAEDIEDNYRRVYGSGIDVPPKKLLLS